jgi:hypothetical protein
MIPGKNDIAKKFSIPDSRFSSSIGHPASRKWETTGYEQNPDYIGNDAGVRLVNLNPLHPSQ